MQCPMNVSSTFRICSPACFVARRAQLRGVAAALLVANFILSGLVANAQQATPELAKVTEFGEEFAWVQKKENRRWRAVNRTGKKLFKLRPYPQYLLAPSYGLSAIKFNDQWGFVDREGKYRVEPGYELVGRFHEGLAWVVDQNQFGFIDTTGEEVIAPEYPIAMDFSEGYAPVYNDTVWGFIDRSGSLRIPYAFYGVKPFKNGLAPAMDELAWGLIDQNGAWVVTPKYAFVGEFTEDGLAIAASFNVDTITVYDSIFTPVDSDELNELASTTGEVAMENVDTLVDINENTNKVYKLERVDTLRQPRVRPDSLYGYVARDGRYSIKPQYKALKPFREGLAAVKVDSAWGYINPAGRMVIAPTFDRAENFSEGLAPVQLNKQWGYIDREGNIRINPQFDEARAFKNGLAIVQVDGKFGFIDPSGKLVVGD